MVAGAELKRNRPRETMGSSASVFAQVIMSSLYVIFVVSDCNKFWYVKAGFLCRGSSKTLFGSVSPCGRLSFLLSFGMSKLVSSVEAALK